MQIILQWLYIAINYKTHTHVSRYTQIQKYCHIAGNTTLKTIEQSDQFKKINQNLTQIY